MSSVMSRELRDEFEAIGHVEGLTDELSAAYLKLESSARPVYATCPSRTGDVVSG